MAVCSKVTLGKVGVVERMVHRIGLNHIGQTGVGIDDELVIILGYGPLNNCRVLVGVHVHETVHSLAVESVLILGQRTLGAGMNGQQQRCGHRYERLGKLYPYGHLKG